MSYTFTLTSTPTGPAEIDALSGAHRDQFLMAGKAAMEGKPFNKPSDFFHHTADELEEDVEEQYVELWTITREGKDKPLYELWYFPADDAGSVFEANKAKSAGVEIIDGTFEAQDSGKKAEKLAEELQDPFEDREVDPDEDDEEEDEDDEDEDNEDDEDEDDDDDEDEDEDDDEA